MIPDLAKMDAIIDKYAELRKNESRERAFETVRFSVYSNVDRTEAAETFHNLGCVARSYAEVCRMMSRPRCGIEVPLALSTICFSIASMYFAPAMAGQEGMNITRPLIALNGILLFIYIVRQIAWKWCEFRILAAIYDELAEFASREMGLA